MNIYITILICVLEVLVGVVIGFFIGRKSLLQVIKEKKTEQSVNTNESVSYDILTRDDEVGILAKNIMMVVSKLNKINNDVAQSKAQLELFTVADTEEFTQNANLNNLELIRNNVNELVETTDAEKTRLVSINENIQMGTKAVGMALDTVNNQTKAIVNMSNSVNEDMNTLITQVNQALNEDVTIGLQEVARLLDVISTTIGVEAARSGDSGKNFLPVVSKVDEVHALVVNLIQQKSSNGLSIDTTSITNKVAEMSKLGALQGDQTNNLVSILNSVNDNLNDLLGITDYINAKIDILVNTNAQLTDTISAIATKNTNIINNNTNNRLKVNNLSATYTLILDDLNVINEVVAQLIHTINCFA